MSNAVTIATLQKMKERGEKITCLTAYDYSMAALLEGTRLDLVLVGDSLGMTVRGERDTLKVTVDEVAYHVGAVRAGVQRAFLLADMPFLSCSINDEETLKNAGTLIAAGAQGVKLEGASPVILSGIRRLVESGIPVMGHLGLTPQSIHQLGGYRIQGKEKETATRIIEQAVEQQEAGAFAVLLECVPTDLARQVTECLRVPTIGIGAGEWCDGQILVINDLLGLNNDFAPKFVKKYANLSKIIHEAVETYIDESKNSLYPDAAHSYHVPQGKDNSLQNK